MTQSNDKPSEEHSDPLIRERLAEGIRAALPDTVYAHVSRDLQARCAKEGGGKFPWTNLQTARGFFRGYRREFDERFTQHPEFETTVQYLVDTGGTSGQEWKPAVEKLADLYFDIFKTTIDNHLQSLENDRRQNRAKKVGCMLKGAAAVAIGGLVLIKGGCKEKPQKLRPRQPRAVASAPTDREEGPSAVSRLEGRDDSEEIRR